MVLTAGYISRHIIFALACGIVSAAFIATDFLPMQTAHLIVQKLWNNSDLWRLGSWDLFWQGSNFFILTFLFMLAILTVLISYSGGAYAYARSAQRYINNATQAQTATGLLSTSLAIDDYFSSLTVGSVMRGITDQFQIPRVKLAFIVDALAAPLVILCPVSSWIASIVGFLGDNGISLTQQSHTLILADPFTVYIRTLPFLFYSLILIVAVFFIIRRNLSWGPMHTQEQIARHSGNLFGGNQAVTYILRSAPERNIQKSHIADFLVPILTLIATVMGGLLISGGYHPFIGTRGLFNALQHAQAAPTLFVGGILTLCITTLFYLARSLMRMKDIAPLFRDGIQLMYRTILMLLCAWTLGDLLRENLLTGNYVGSLIHALHLPLSLLPVVLFVSSCLTAFAIGSSWATMAIFFPIAIPMVLAVLNVQTPTTLAALSLLLPALGAVFSGAVAGHNSPISDTTFMSATSSGAYLLDHIQTKLGYTVIVLGSTALAFTACGLALSHGLLAAFIAGIVAGLGSCLTTMLLLNHYAKRS